MASESRPSFSEPAPPRAEGYVVAGLLGRGGAGMVWRATQEGTLREVALKFLAPWHRHGMAGLRFQREVEIAASLEHDNIVRVYDSGEGASGPWLAMEFVDGPTADRWIAESCPSLRERVEFFRGVCAGVRHAHQRGVIHRDLKPGNILVAPGSVAKVTDFGLAGQQDSDSLAISLTRHGEVFGSVAWMPPEQAEGRWKEVDALSDVYALGAVLFSLVTGQPPVDPCLPSAAQLAAAKSGERRRLHDVRPEVPRDLEAIVDRCMAPEKARRYQSAAALEEDVARWLAGEPVKARNAAPFYWMRKKLRRHWIAAAAALTVLCSAAGGAWGYFRGQRELEDQRRGNAERVAAQTALTLHEAQELVTQLLVEMRPRFQEAGHPEWIDEAEKRVAAFPWDVGGTGQAAWDSRRFHGRAALVQGDAFKSEAQWGSALSAYQAAIRQLQGLVDEQPAVTIFREELAMARIGEAYSLIKLRFHKEACGAGRKALVLLGRGVDGMTTPGVWNAMVDAGCVMAEGAQENPRKMADVLPFLSEFVQRLPGGPEVEGMDADQAEWHGRIHTAMAELQLATNGDATLAEAGALKAVQCGRHALKARGECETSLRLLAAALATEATVAIRLEQAQRAIAVLNEASGILADKLGPPPPSMSAGPYEAVAVGWEELSLYIKRMADDMRNPAFNQWAFDAAGGAVRMWELIRRTKRDSTGQSASSRLSLRNVVLMQDVGNAAEAASWAARTVRIFEIAHAGKTSNFTVGANAAEAALRMCEAKAPERGAPSPSWSESASRALESIERIRQRLRKDERARLEELTGRRARIAPPAGPAGAPEKAPEEKTAEPAASRDVE